MEFSYFPKLPIELRMKIWKLSWLPRNVTVIVHSRRSYEWLQFHLFGSRTPVPSALHVCRESRAEASRIYKLRFDTDTRNYPESYRSAKYAFWTWPRVYFSYKMDNVHFYWGRMPPSRQGAITPHENLTFVDLANIRSWSSDEYPLTMDSLFDEVRLYNNLKEVVLPMELLSAEELLRNKIVITPGHEVLIEEADGEPSLDCCIMENMIQARNSTSLGQKLPAIRFVEGSKQLSGDWYQLFSA